MKRKFCIDCGVEISRKAKSRCVTCYHKIHSKMIKGKNNPNYKDGRTIIEEFCLICKKRLITTYKSKHGLCKNCLLKSSTHHPSITHGKSMRNKTHYCIDCKKQVSEHRAIRCKICFYKYLSIIKCKNNKIKQKYPSIWTKNLRNKIRERDKNTCQICGKKEIKIHFSVHHIDYNKYNCDLNNLITLCASCHCKTNYIKEAWKYYFQNKKYLLYSFPRIVYVPGSWDLLHVGHINLLKKVREFGDYIIVGVSTNKLINSYKKTNPIISYKNRITLIKALRGVDNAIKQAEFFNIKQLKKEKITHVILGNDWENKSFPELDKLKKELNINVVYLEYTKGISTTEIKRKIIKNSYDIIKAELKRQ